MRSQVSHSWREAYSFSLSYARTQPYLLPSPSHHSASHPSLTIVAGGASQRHYAPRLVEALVEYTQQGGCTLNKTRPIGYAITSRVQCLMNDKNARAKCLEEARALGTRLLHLLSECERDVPEQKAPKNVPVNAPKHGPEIIPDPRMFLT